MERKHRDVEWNNLRKMIMKFLELFHFLQRYVKIKKRQSKYFDAL